jgi:hypothetical protein
MFIDAVCFQRWELPVVHAIEKKVSKENRKTANL